MKKLLFIALALFILFSCEDPVNSTINYTITFNANHPSATGSTASITGNAGDTVSLTANGFSLTGYTFTGWNTASNGSGTSYADGASVTLSANITLYAQWAECEITNRTYTVTIAENIVNGRIYASKVNGIVAGETVTLTIVPANGYTIASITVENGEENIIITNNTFTMPAANVIISATFEALPPSIYSVTFNTNGGSAIANQTVRGGSNATRPSTNPTKDSTLSTRYTFDNWYTSSDGGETLSATAFNFNTPITTNTVLYAKWNETAITYMVRFNTNGGIPGVYPQTVRGGSNATRPSTNPTKDSALSTRYTFDNWYTSSDGGETLSATAFDFNTPITTNTVLYAKWNETAITYTVTFNTNGGSAVESQTVRGGSNATRPSTNPTKDSTLSTRYTFDNWYTSSDGGETLSATTFDFNTPITANTVLYAKWNETAITYTVRFDTNGGNYSPAQFPQTVRGGSNAKRPTNPIHSNSWSTEYTFDDWYTSSDGGETLSATAFDFNTPITTNTVLYAKWNEIERTYTVTFNTNGGGFIESQTVRAGSTIARPNAPTRNGYVFMGWYSEYDPWGKHVAQFFDFSSPIKSNKTLYADWFVPVTGSTVTGPVDTETRVFAQGRTVIIENLYVCDHEVTQKEYETYCSYADSHEPTEYRGKGLNYPAYSISWYDAIVYCNLRSIAEGLTPVYEIGDEDNPLKWPGIVGAGKYRSPDNPTGWVVTMKGTTDTIVTTANGYRLPTEAEWAYIANGAFANIPYYCWSGSTDSNVVAWYNTNSDNKAHEVKTKKANTLGIYDMSGNVFELCWDCYGSLGSITSTTPVTGPTSDSRRLIRGGSYITSQISCMVNGQAESYRPVEPRDRDDLIGFRVVRNAD